MKVKRLRIKWKNVIKLPILILCLSIMIIDYLLILISMGGFATFDLIIFGILALISDIIIDDFEHEKSTHTDRLIFAMSTNK